MKLLAWTATAMMAGVAVGFALVYGGAFNVAADDPHWDLTTRALAWVRERGVEVRSVDTSVPNLADPALVATGAEHYAVMCEGCHLAPGVPENELRQGLNPKPPNLSHRRDRPPAESFWIIKHGIKMSGMPAWGVTHDDDAIWGLVAFLQQLPLLDARGYQAYKATGGPAGMDAVPEGHVHGADRHGDPEGRDDAMDRSGPDDPRRPSAMQTPHDHVHGREATHDR